MSYINLFGWAATIFLLFSLSCLVLAFSYLIYKTAQE